MVRHPQEIPDSRSYAGHDGLRRALADWPQQWESFEITEWNLHPVDAPNAIIIETRQHLRARGGLEFDLDVFNDFVFGDDGLARVWEMFLDRETAVARLQSALLR